MNDSYFPKNQLIVTEREKREFLNHLSNDVPIDEKIRKSVEMINGMPYFLTQSSCQGQGNDPSSSHTPVPYVTIGVLYNAFHLLDELAEFILEKMPKKLSVLDFSFEVQAINTDKETGISVPNFQKYLSIALKNQRAIETLESVLNEYSKREFSINREIENIRFDLISKAKNTQFLFDTIIEESNVIFPLDVEIAPYRLQKLKQNLSENQALKTVKLIYTPPMQGFPESYTIEFYVLDETYDIDRLFELLCSGLTGGMIGTQLFQPTSSGNYLKLCQMTLFNLEKSDFFAALVEYWAKKRDALTSL